MQQMLMIVDPWGDDRADKRAALNTTAIAEGDREEIYSALIGYLKINEADSNAGPAQARRMLES